MNRLTTDFGAVATFKAAGPETSIDPLVVAVSMLLEATVVPNLLARWILVPPVRASIRPGRNIVTVQPVQPASSTIPLCHAGSVRIEQADQA